MPLNDVEEVVLNKARAEAAELLKRARSDADALWQSESARLRDEHARRIEAFRSEQTTALERVTGAREAEDRHTLLRAKNEILDTVFRSAAEGIRSLPADGYRLWLRSRLAGVRGIAGARIAVSERDRSLVTPLLNEVGLPLAQEPAAIQAGFLVIGERADLDFSVESLLANLRQSMTERVAQQLFDEA